MLGQVQESVEAAEDLAQEVRDPLIFHPRQQTIRMGFLMGEVTGQPWALTLGRFFQGISAQRAREGAPGEVPCSA